MNEALKTHYVTQVSDAPGFEEVLLSRNRESYRNELSSLVSRLGTLSTASTFSLEERRHLAYAIAGDDIPVESIRMEMASEFCSVKATVPRRTMRALDGGVTEMWAQSRQT